MILGLRLLIPADFSVEQAPIRLQTAEIHAGTEISSIVGKEAGNSAAFWYAGENSMDLCVLLCTPVFCILLSKAMETVEAFFSSRIGSGYTEFVEGYVE